MGREILSLPAPAADERVVYGDHPSQFIDFRKGTRPALAVMLHGGFWRSRFDLLYAGHVCEALRRHGVSTANVEYRRVGESGGGWPGMFSDVRAAVHLARSHTKIEKCIVMGHSAGGHLALWLACEMPDLKAAIGLGAVASLRKAYELHLSDDAVVELMGGPPNDAYKQADPAQRSTSVPRVLAHGGKDTIVPRSVADDYLKSNPAAKLLDLPDADHFDVIDPRSAAWPTIEREILRFA